MQPTVAVPGPADAEGLIAAGARRIEGMETPETVDPRDAPAREAPESTPSTEDEPASEAPPPPVAPTLASNAFAPPNRYPAAPEHARSAAALREQPGPWVPGSRGSEPPGAGAASRGRMLAPTPVLPHVTPIAPSAPIGAASWAAPTSVTGVSGRSTSRPLSPTPRKSAWTPRPLPVHVRGKCHVRGSVARAVRRWIDRTCGPEACEDVLRALPGELADLYRGDAFNSLVWYDAAALDAFLEAATVLALGGDATAWRDLARDHFDADFAPIFRTATRVTDPLALFKRTAPTWNRLYDFGTVRVAEPPRQTGPATTTRVHLRFEGFDAASLALRNATVGTAEGLLRAQGVREVSSRVLTGEASFLRDFEFELAWPHGA
jgi:hypothetical protein